MFDLKVNQKKAQEQNETIFAVCCIFTAEQ